MSSRDEILARLQRTPGQLPDMADHHRSYDDLVTQFTNALQANKGEAHRVKDLSAAAALLDDLFADLKIEQVVAHREAPLDQLDLPERFPEQSWYFAGEEDNFRGLSAQADAGITGADTALAETGTLVLSSAASRARATSLLPPVHIVLLPASKLLPGIFTFVQQRQGEMPANLMFISGPSKTADIEQTLVTGVHGPKRLIVIVIEKL